MKELLKKHFNYFSRAIIEANKRKNLEGEKIPTLRFHIFLYQIRKGLMSQNFECLEEDLTKFQVH